VKGDTVGWCGSMGGGFMMLFWIALLGVVVYLIVRQGQRNAPQADSALDILKRRYARGEISKSEFEERKKDIL